MISPVIAMNEIANRLSAAIATSKYSYGELAKHESIFKCAFTDADAISEGYTGYVAIASALGFLDCFDGTLVPGELLQNGEAAQIVYDYLLHLNAEQAK